MSVAKAVQSEPTLGEILAAALTEVQEYEPSLLDRWMICGRELARCAAPALGVSEQAVWSALTHVPDASLPLLDEPAGWAALVDVVAIDLGVAAAPFHPAVH